MASVNFWVIERKGTVDIFDARNPMPREQQIEKYLDEKITKKLDNIKKAITEGNASDLAAVGITDRSKAQIGFEFHGTPRPDGSVAPINLEDLGLVVERMKAWEALNPGYKIAIKW